MRKEREANETNDKYVYCNAYNVVCVHFVLERTKLEGKKGGEIPKRHSPFLSLILSFYISLSVFLFADVLNIHLIRSTNVAKIHESSSL